MKNWRALKKQQVLLTVHPSQGYWCGYRVFSVTLNALLSSLETYVYNLKIKASKSSHVTGQNWCLDLRADFFPVQNKGRN